MAWVSNLFTKFSKWIAVILGNNAVADSIINISGRFINSDSLNRCLNGVLSVLTVYCDRTSFSFQFSTCCRCTVARTRQFGLFYHYTGLFLPVFVVIAVPRVSELLLELNSCINKFCVRICVETNNCCFLKPVSYRRFSGFIYFDYYCCLRFALASVINYCCYSLYYILIMLFCVQVVIVVTLLWIL